VIILVAVAFVGGTAAMPYVVEQGFSVGDTFVYEWTETNDTGTITYTDACTVTAVNGTTVAFTYNYSDYYPNGTWDITLQKDGGKTYSDDDYMFVNDPSALPAERSYTVMMIGFTPIIVEAYSVDLGDGDTFDFWVKAGTLFIVKSVWVVDGNMSTVVLKETSLKWVMLI
jgi:hypothetical protein